MPTETPSRAGAQWGPLSLPRVAAVAALAGLLLAIRLARTVSRSRRLQVDEIDPVHDE